MFWRLWTKVVSTWEAAEKSLEPTDFDPVHRDATTKRSSTKKATRNTHPQRYVNRYVNSLWHFSFRWCVQRWAKKDRVGRRMCLLRFARGQENVILRKKKFPSNLNLRHTSLWLRQKNLVRPVRKEKSGFPLKRNNN